MQSDQTSSPVTIDEYIALQPEQFRFTLNQLRAIILSVVPDAEEMISYKVPSFKYLYMLVGIGATKKHCSFYIMSSSLSKELKEELKDASLTGTTLHFTPGELLPEEMIKRIIRARMAQNELKYSKKNRKS
jgi:uncharacterized protein YdhG (YjbR/CyaY superfamily)